MFLENYQLEWWWCDAWVPYFTSNILITCGTELVHSVSLVSLLLLLKRPLHSWGCHVMFQTSDVVPRKQKSSVFHCKEEISVGSLCYVMMKKLTLERVQILHLEEKGFQRWLLCVVLPTALTYCNSVTSEKKLSEAPEILPYCTGLNWHPFLFSFWVSSKTYCCLSGRKHKVPFQAPSELALRHFPSEISCVCILLHFPAFALYFLASDPLWWCQVSM